MRLLLFNPETEYALASGASFYTPPARVERMRRELQLLPEEWAKPDDFILVDDPSVLHSDFRLVSWVELKSLFVCHPDLKVEPWGWNPALIRRLRDAGVPPCHLPDEDAMSRIRRLAHRRTTILLNTLWNKFSTSSCVPLQGEVGPNSGCPIPVELRSEEECMRFYEENPGCWMKAPWSSSGRGVINTSADMTPELVRQWCHGILRRQGSVMGETGADRVADFATEWSIEGGEACFIGLSCFNTSNRGKYISNESIPQRDMKVRFDSLALMSIDDVVPIQKMILEKVLIGYEGPCGVDMLIERGGHIRPFVELNLRRTMGMLGCSLSIAAKP